MSEPIIKFEAWNVQKKEMIEVRRLTLFPDTHWHFCAACGLHIGVSGKDFKLRQYIGRHDVNGKEIFGGDICKFDIGQISMNLPKLHFRTVPGAEGQNPIESFLVVIEYKNSAWGFRHLFPDFVCESDRGWQSFWRPDIRECWNEEYFEVVSDIFRNPLPEHMVESIARSSDE